MPKNPWIHKSRKRRRKRKKSPEDGELNSRLPTSSEMDIRMGTLSSEILPLPLNQMKKEIFYPDTRFQRSTTLFPAIVEDNSEIPRKILKRDPEEIPKDLGQEAERIEGASTDPSIEVMSEITLPSDNLQKYEDTIYPDSKFQRSSPLFPAQGIENIIPSEKHSETARRDPEDEESVSGQEVELIEYYKMPDPSISTDYISSDGMSEISLSNDNPLKFEDTVKPDTRFQRTTTVFSAEEVEIIPLEKPIETLPAKDYFETMPEKAKMNDLPSYDYCISIGNSYSLDEVEEIDLTDGSHGVMRQPIILGVESIPLEKPTETLHVNDAFEKRPEKVKMNDLFNSDYCVVIGNSNSLDEVDEIDLTDGSHRVLSRFITLD